MYSVELSRQSQKDLVNLKQAGLLMAARELVEIIKENPFQTPPPYEKLVGNLAGKYSRRINIKHRLVYSVLEEEKTIIILRMWSHYE
ncbi:MAG TPA: Txe/YoeB family addiction module toxin [Desulfosporosinus sp.]|nr:Txe/YoeB family addiction module toxin [Desulfosporosinus sp.]